MLKLKKLQILGFKSFCDRTELKFHGEGIAAIVGPNGCGKSNIADSIAWVLGEQSAKSLRGARMEDVIFIGTRDRKPTGMAEVSLTFIDPAAYEGAAALADVELPEIEIKDEMEDWDEATARAQAATETQAAIDEVQPLGVEEVAVSASEADDSAAEQSTTAENGDQHVVLKIRRRRLKAPNFAAGEVVVTRRLFRSGESEYLLNGKICRLRDIQDLFMGTGLGPESYAIIEQGRIGQILSSKPHDRRAVIEEAAGVTRFKARKRLAESRLEQSQQNLARIDDIFEEVTRQMNSLKRQASKAERYSKLREEMRQKLRLVLANRFLMLESESGAIAAQLGETSVAMEAGSTAVQQMESEHSIATQQNYAVEEEIRQSAERLSALALEQERIRARRQHNQERCAELKARSAGLRVELQQVGQQHAEFELEREANQTALEGAQEEVASARALAEEKQRQAEQAGAAVTDLEARQEQRRAEILPAAAAGSELRNQLARNEEQVAALNREAARFEQEMAQAASQIQSFTNEQAQLKTNCGLQAERLQSAQQNLTEARTGLEQKRSAERQMRQRLDALRAEHATLLGRRASLEALITEHGYSSASVKRLFQSGGSQNFTPAGVLADFLEVEGRYEAVIEDFLRDELNYVVVKSWDAADEGLRLLRSDADGRATFLVHPEDAQARFSFVLDEGSRLPARPESILPLKNCIRVLNGFGKSLEVILPKLGNGYIAPDAAMAKELALENPNAFFLAPTGETFHNVTVTGGKQRSEGPLAMKRELRELLLQLKELERRLSLAQTEVSRLEGEIIALADSLESLERAKLEAESQSLGSTHALRQLEGSLARAKQQLSTARTDAQRLERERSALTNSAEQLRRQEREYEEKRFALEQQFAAAQTEVAERKLARETAAQYSSQAYAQLAATEERLRAAASAFDRIRAIAEQTGAHGAALEQQLASAATEREQRALESQDLAAQSKALATEQEQFTERRASLQLDVGTLRARLQQMEAQLRTERHQLDQLRDRRGELAAQAARLQSDIGHLAEISRNELNLSREELAANISSGSLSSEALTFEEATVRELRERLEAMAPVNMMALEEYKEVAERHGFLEAQRRDLLESIANTQASIRELDQLTRQKFQEAFERINENFQFAFRNLFGGGQAFMRLTDEENSGDSGIDVIASPPGKKLQNVLLLSGGEKALTALALLMGIFQYQPSPFCLLDEVDAPLDEANVGRFTEMVKELSLQTQFILITHNKRTMGTAPVLYGVTMQEPGVSKIVSVRFGQQDERASA